MRLSLAVLLVASLGCAGGGSTGPGPDQLSLIWISLDTLRADHLELYGYSRDTSPFLRELAERGLYFDWAVSPQNSTLPSHLTQFTGIHPVVHGVMHSRANVGIRLADSVRTLPEVLRDAGFRTRGWADGGKMSSHYGFARGFEEYDESRPGLPQNLSKALDALIAFEEGERFFLFLHTYQAHAPYKPPRPYRQRYLEADAFKGTPGKINRYDGSIRFIDDQLRAFVGELEHRGVLDTTILVITADHGESFQEYGIPIIGHAGDNLHQNITRVPWILLHPSDRYRGKVTKLVGLIDFASTMLALLGVEERLSGQGIDVLAEDAPAHRFYVSWTGEPLKPGCAWSLYAGEYHLLECEGETGSARNGLYHRGRDPQERWPIADAELTAKLSAQLEKRKRELAGERARRLDSLRDFAPAPDVVHEQLKALGYLGGPGG